MKLDFKNILSILTIIIFASIFLSIYGKTTGAKAQCKDICLSEGAIDYSWSPELVGKNKRTRETYIVEPERCTCISKEDAERKKLEYQNTLDAIREHKKKMGKKYD